MYLPKSVNSSVKRRDPWNKRTPKRNPIWLLRKHLLLPNIFIGILLMYSGKIKKIMCEYYMEEKLITYFIAFTQHIVRTSVQKTHDNPNKLRLGTIRIVDT